MLVDIFKSMHLRLDIELKKAQARLKKDSRIKECFHFDKASCSKDIISAHSLQENKVLSLLQDKVNENFAVYSFLYHEYSPEGDIVGFEPLGKKVASTFFGFCSYHDNFTFSPIENFPIDLENNEHCFLLSYRAFAKDFHAKYESLQGYRTNEDMRDSPGNLVNELISGSELGLRDSLIMKDRMNNILKAQAYDELEVLTFKLDYMVPIALASSMTPDYSYKNEVLNKSSDPATFYEFVNFVIQPVETGETLILLSCLPEHTKSIKFIDQLDSLKEIPFLKAISSLAVSHVENTFFSPKIWKQLTKEEQSQLLHELQITTPSIRSRSNKFFHSELNLLDRRFKKSIT